jgi:hypothetical protein
VIFSVSIYLLYLIRAAMSNENDADIKNLPSENDRLPTSLQPA